MIGLVVIPLPDIFFDGFYGFAAHISVALVGPLCIVKFEPSVEILLELGNGTEGFLSKREAKELVEDGAVKAFDKAVGLRAADAACEGSGPYKVEGFDSDKPRIVWEVTTAVSGAPGSSSGSGTAHIDLVPLDTSECVGE